MFVQRSWQVLQFKGDHVLIEIPVNLSKLLIHPVVTFGLSHAKMISEQGQNILTVHRQKISCTSAQNIEQNYQIWDIINVLALGNIQNISKYTC